jgi:chemotaxis response regulator CheB
VGIIMTGMGEDGAEGLGAIKAAGGMTIAQSEETCVVGGMPRAAILKGHANKIISLDGLAAHLVSHYGNDRSGSGSNEKSDAHDKSEKNEKGDRTPVSTPRT